MAVAKHRADLKLDDLQDDPLNPVSFADDTCTRMSDHTVTCELFVEHDTGDTCDCDYDVFYTSPHGRRVGTRLHPCR